MATKSPAKKSGSKSSKKQPPSDPSVSYDEWKFFEGEFYKGVKIGRGHKWYYDKGVWKDKKVTPDMWQINYAVTKRRAGRAPEGSGAPVGTEYHWYIVAHQMVKKLNANDYTTSMAGLKYKVAHKRADNGKWSATPKTQRKRMIKFLKSVIDDLEQQAAAELDGASKKTSAKKSSAKKASTSKKVSANGQQNGSVKKTASKSSGSGARKRSRTTSSSKARKKTVPA